MGTVSLNHIYSQCPLPFFLNTLNTSLPTFMSSPFGFYISHCVQSMLPIGMLTDLLDLIFCRTCAGDRSWVWELMGVMTISWRQHSTAFLLILQLLHSSWSLFGSVSQTLDVCVGGGDYGIDVLFRPELTQHFDQQWVCINCWPLQKEEFLQGWEQGQSMATILSI